MGKNKKRNIKYEYIYKSRGKLYARIYDEDLDVSILNEVKYTPSFYVKAPRNISTNIKSVLTGESLKEIKPNNIKEYKEQLQMYKQSGSVIYGNPSQEQGYIRDTFGNPNDNDHEFHTWYFDIETMVDKEDPGHDKKLDWRPTKSERAATAIVTSIQIYDSKHKDFIIFGLKQDWENKRGFKSEHGPIRYYKFDDEPTMLKAFIKLLHQRNPLVITGWNTEFYDFPYITNRVIRILDNRNDLYFYDEDKQRFLFNRDCLNGKWVQQLSPVKEIKFREVQTDFGFEDTYDWLGFFCIDYKNYYRKYTYASLTSYSLESVGTYELGEGKVVHDEFADFGEFYKQDFEKFIEYGIRDVEILVELNDKLKLINLAKYISYNCGVNLNDVSGTLKQWVSFVYNESLKAGLVLPMENQFPDVDDFLLRQAQQMESLSSEKKEFYNKLYNYKDEEGYSWRGQKFPGGWTRGTSKFWKWVFSLDFTSLYPSVIMFANIGIETLIQPKDLPQELLELRAKYFIYYPKYADSRELEEYDYRFIQDVLRNDEVREEINSVLKKYNVSATPNGMFFKKDRRSIISQIIENLMKDRKSYKKDMKKIEQEMEDLKFLLDSSEDKNEIENKIFAKKQLFDMYNVYQMGVKILMNSQYGSNSMKANVFAGHPEYFSAAITSTARIANILISQEQSKHISELSGVEPQEMIYGMPNFLDNVAQADTDSCYNSLEPVIKKKFGEDYENSTPRERLVEFTKNYIEKVAIPIVEDRIENVLAFTLNSYLPEKLVEDAEIIADNFISIAPKMYFCRIWWNEGVTLAKHKLKVTGLSMVRSNTPKLFREKLKNAMEILIEGETGTVVEYIKEVKEEAYKATPKDIAINVGVSSIDYQWDENTKKFRKWTGKKFLGAPINSRAALVHNKYITENDVNVREIEAGDKISFIELKVPNPTLENVIAFQQEEVFEKGLKEYIDVDTMFFKGFLNPIHLITNPLGWDVSLEKSEIDMDEW